MLVTLAIVVVVLVLVASIAVFASRGGSHGGNGFPDGTGFSIEALASATANESARVTITVAIPASLSPGSAAGTPTPPALVYAGLMNFRHPVGRITIEDTDSHGMPEQIGTELLIDWYSYSSITPANAATIPAQIRRTKRWLRLPPRRSAVAFGLNPFDPLAQFRSHHVTLKDFGVTRLGDQTVHRYEGTERPSFTPPSSRGPRETLTVVFDIYVDSHDRLVRLTSITKQPGVAAAATAQIDFADYGVRVNVTAPPADEVYEPPADTFGESSLT